MGFSSLHCHTEYSNAGLGFPDSANKTEDLIKRAKEIGLNSIAITDHEILSGHYKALKYGEKYGVNVILGNEIYLMDDTAYETSKEDLGAYRYYPHFILLALDDIGHKQLRELSSISWRDNSYYYKGLLRRPTKTSDIEKIIGQEKGHIFASSACLGSQFAHLCLDLFRARNENDTTLANYYKNQIKNFVGWCLNVFGKDYFAIEIQPNMENTEQWEYNKLAVKIAKAYKIPFIVTTDAHYLSKEQKEIHKALLNSKEEEDREVDEFYSTAYLMEEKEIREYLKDNLSQEDIDSAISNTVRISNLVKGYNLSATQIVPTLPVPDFTITHKLKEYYDKYPYLKMYAESDNTHFRYMLYRIENAVYEKYEQDMKILPMTYKGDNGEESVVLEKYSFEDLIARINTEFKDLWLISDILKQPMPAYYLTMSKICETIWDKADSLIGASRGSACGLSLCYLLNISQINPIWFGDQMPSWRHISAARSSSLPDVDIDLQYSKKPQIMQSMVDLFGDKNVLQVCTFGTLTAKNALRTAGRGLKLVDPDITDEVVSMFSDLVKIDRGKSYTIDECLYGNEEQEKEPIKEFVNLAKSYPQLIETARGLEGLIMNRSEHASGVILSNYDYSEHGACMKSQKGNLTTQFNLEDCEAMGNLKYDFLMLTGLEKIRTCINFLIKNKLIKDYGSIKETYNHYFAPWVLNYSNPKIWENLAHTPTLFQFETEIGLSALKLTTPKNILDLSAANSLMRLKGEIDGLNCMQRFAKYQTNIEEWYADMTNNGLTVEEQEIFKKYLSSSRGLCDSQEKIMLLVMDSGLCNADLKFADKVRKTIAKKKTQDIAKIKETIYQMGEDNGASKNAIDYLWNYCITPSLGYSFSSIHSLGYSTIGVQECVLYNDYPAILWATACLISDSGTDENTENKSQDYGKIASAIYNILSYGIEVSTPDINVSKFGFEPIIEDNKIVFGLKGITSINDDLTKLIIENQPYTSVEDFIQKIQPTKIQMINLIKSGAFDKISHTDKETLMKQYVKNICLESLSVKNKLTGSNLSNIISLGILPKEYDIYSRYYNFNKYVTDKRFVVDKIKNKTWLIAKDIAFPFFEQHYISELQEELDYKYTSEGIVFNKSSYNKIYKSKMERVLSYINTPEFIKLYNDTVLANKIKEIWDKYCLGSMADWEFDSISFYHEKHALSHINANKYNISSFSSIPEDPTVEEEYMWKDRLCYKYKISRICGTVLDSNRTKHTVTLLTHDNEVVTIKFYAGAFINYNKTIKEVVDGKNVTKEASWFTRGNKLIIVGYRSGDMFRPKKYKDSVYRHTVSLIENINKNGDLTIRELRYGEKDYDWSNY